WTGGTSMAADAITIVTAQAAFASGSAVFQADASVANNPNTNIDGIRAVGTAAYSGIAAYGGNKAGTAYYGVGGPATGTGGSGPGVRVYAGTSAATQSTGPSIQGYQQNQQNAVYTYNAVLGAAGSAAHNSSSNG